MSNTWYQTNVKFTKEYRDGTLKRVTEPYLVSALNHGEAEARIYTEVGEYVRGEFLVKAVRQVDFADIFIFEDDPEDCTFYKCKISYVTEDADSGKEKVVNNNFLVDAHNVIEAAQRMRESLKHLMVKFEITQITKTKFVNIFPYVPEDEEEEEKAPTSSPNINVAYAADEEE